MFDNYRMKVSHSIDKTLTKMSNLQVTTCIQSPFYQKFHKHHVYLK